MSKYNRSFVEDDAELEELETQQEAQADLKEAEATKEGDPKRENWKKRYSDVRRHMEEQRLKTNEEISQLKQTVAELSTKGMNLPKTEDELNDWADRNPDAAGILETLVQKRIQENSAVGEERIARLEARESEMKRREGIDAIRAVHPDFDSLKSDDDFAAWLADCEIDPNRSHHHHALVKGNDPRLAIDAITIFKTETGKASSKEDDPKPKRKQKSAGAAKAVSAKSPASDIRSNADFDFSESQIQRMPPHEFEENEDAILEAHQKGRIEMDISGGAR